MATGAVYVYPVANKRVPGLELMATDEEIGF